MLNEYSLHIILADVSMSEISGFWRTGFVSIQIELRS
jgi:hypothetical protein